MEKHTLYTLYTTEKELIGSDLLPEPLECWCGIGDDDSQQLCTHPSARRQQSSKDLAV
jgi:hypothetical protein